MKKINNGNPLMQGHETDLLLLQHMRMARLRANTSSLMNTQLNSLLVENQPSNRVLSGEAIIFQREVLDVFKDLINHSTYPIFQKSSTA